MIVLRPAASDEAARLVAIQVAARAVAPMPAAIHAEADVAAFLGSRHGVDETWVAEVDGEAVAYARFTATWLDDLYVHPSAQGRGIGSALLDLVMALRPEGLGLYVFESNLPAQRFYAGRGFVVTARHDGHDNEEREPDLRMEWAGSAPG